MNVVILFRRERVTWSALGLPTPPPAVDNNYGYWEWLSLTLRVLMPARAPINKFAASTRRLTSFFSLFFSRRPFTSPPLLGWSAFEKGWKLVVARRSRESKNEGKIVVRIIVCIGIRGSLKVPGNRSKESFGWWLDYGFWGGLVIGSWGRWDRSERGLLD